MDDGVDGGGDALAGRFEEHRTRLRAVAYRMLGSHAEAEDAVQEAWLRVARAGDDDVTNLGGWLTTIVARQCLNMLRSRTTRREYPLDVHVPDPVVSTGAGADPADQALLADSVSLALLVVLESLDPAERLALVLHDMFAVPFDEVAPIVGRTPAATRQLASRARRRVRTGTPTPDPDPARRQRVADAWLAASQGGDFAALLALLAPDAVLRVDGGGAPGASRLVRGAAQVAGQALLYAAVAPHARPALVNGEPGLVSAPDGLVVAVLAFTIADGRIHQIDILSDPDRVRALAIVVP
ncbi:sigma-70 family RNA polymerase sigma factor [Pseudonocardia saturnea]